MATVHWKTDKWVEIQNRAFQYFIDQPFKVFAFLNDIDTAPYVQLFDFVQTEEIGGHADKLNYLAAKICEQGEDEDIIIFIDGDAFPVDFIPSRLSELLEKSPLVAVRRVENNGDQQPHPCFCATTVGFWKEIKGDWNEGGLWQDSQGDDVTDVGGNLMKLLNDRKIEWTSLLRSNKFELHVLNHGIYADLVYHHGAGFRKNAGGRVSMVKHGKKREERRLYNKFLRKILPSFLWHKMYEYDIHPLGRMKNKLFRANRTADIAIHCAISRDFRFAKKFISEDPSDWQEIQTVVAESSSH